MDVKEKKNPHFEGKTERELRRAGVAPGQCKIGTLGERRDPPSNEDPLSKGDGGIERSGNASS